MNSPFQGLLLVPLIGMAIVGPARAQLTDVHLPSANTNAPALSPRGAIGVGSWNTAVEFKDIVVTSNDVALYRSDFAKDGTNGLTIFAGDWNVEDGVLRQTSLGPNSRAFFGDPNWGSYTLSLRARTVAGQEGFIVYFNFLAATNWTWFNVAGWTNSLASIDQYANTRSTQLADRVKFSIHSNVWYDVRVVLNGDRMACYVNSNLVQTAAYGRPAPAPVTAPAAMAQQGDFLPFHPAFHGAIGVGSWDTAAEFRDIVVTSNGVVLYRSDFDHDSLDSWQIAGGNWGLTNGALRQDKIDFNCFASIGDTNWSDYTLTLQARKLSGDEGFCVAVGWLESGHTWFNAGSWGNHYAEIYQDCLGRRMPITGMAPLTVETNKWYDVKVVVNGAQVSCYLDSNLVHSATAQVLVSTNATYLGSAPTPDGNDLIFKLGKDKFSGRLTKDRGGPPALESGSLVQVTGTIQPGIDADFQIWSPADVVLLERPSWWTWQRILFFGGGSLATVAIASTWIVVIARKNRLLTLAKGKLQEANDELETRVQRRTADLASAHEQLMEASRTAGMAEVATGILHNVGNVLNSVNVSTTLLAEQLRNSKITSVGRVATLMKDHAADIGDFVANDPKGKQLPEFLGKLSVQLESERARALQELASLQKNVEHIKQIVAMQQNHAGAAGVTSLVNIPELLEDVLRLADSSANGHSFKVAKEFGPNLPDIRVDRHKALQILINLVRNARQSCLEAGASDKKLTLRATAPNGRINISVSDNGVGIPAENLTRIFAQGFTTRKNGHGFGLHSSALAAKDIGGRIVVHSDGPGKGATFTLELEQSL
jgi:signal transduction histidine kinase